MKRYELRQFKCERVVYNAMIGRCHIQGSVGWANYGGRGVIVCDRWRETDGFINFIKDMGRRPQGPFSIDRIDVNGNYEPGNCRWADQYVQARNKRPYYHGPAKGTKINRRKRQKDEKEIND